MRLTQLTLLPLLALSTSASLATDQSAKAGALVSWAHSLVSSGNAGNVPAKSGEVHTFDSWSYVNCGRSQAVDCVI
jgi:hypothetical protein